MMMHNDESTASSAVSVKKIERMLTLKTTRPTTLSAGIIESEVPNKSGYLRKLLSSQSRLYRTTIKFNSNKDDWNHNEMVATGYQLLPLQRECVYSPKAADSASFESVESRDIDVGG